MTEEEFADPDSIFGQQEEPQGKEYGLITKKMSPNSVIFVNYRSVFYDNYPAKFDYQVVDLLLDLYTNPGDIVLDPFVGSGVLVLEAVRRLRNAIGQDINQVAIKILREHYQIVMNRYKQFGHLESLCQDSRQLAARDNSVDFIGTSPPFGLVIDSAHCKYSDHMGDIGNNKDYGGWRVGLKDVLRECFRVLKPGKLFAIEIRPRSKDGHSYPLWHWIHNDCEEIGFEYFTEFIEVNSTFRKWTFGQPEARKPMPNHSFVLIFRKPENMKLL